MSRLSLYALLFAVSLESGLASGRSRLRKVKVCAATLPASLRFYVDAVELRFGPIKCAIAGGDEAAVDANGVPTINAKSVSHLADTAIIAHEMLHLWLGTKGWGISDSVGETYFSKVTLSPGAGKLFTDIGIDLREVVEHRQINQILRKNGVRSGAEERETVLSEIEKLKHSGKQFTVMLALFYLDVRSADEEASVQFSSFLKHQGWEEALTRADEIDALIDGEKPETPEAAHVAIQKCLDIIFVRDSLYLKTYDSRGPR